MSRLTRWGLSSASCWACTAEGHTEDVGFGDAEDVEQVGGLMGEPGHAQGDETGRRLAGARRVVGDRLDAVLDEGILERAPHLDLAAQPHHQQQWTALASHRDAQQVAIDPGEREEPPAG
jgi:hypothetical protein